MPDLSNETYSGTVTENVTCSVTETGPEKVTVSASVRLGEEGGKGGGREKHSCSQHVSASAEKHHEKVEAPRSALTAARSSKNLTREERRIAMPEVTNFIDDMRAGFGCDPVFIDAHENGHRIAWGKRTERV